MEVHEMIAKVTATHKEEHKNIDNGFAIIYAQRDRMADAVGSTIDMLSYHLCLNSDIPSFTTISCHAPDGLSLCFWKQ